MDYCYSWYDRSRLSVRDPYLLVDRILPLTITFVFAKLFVGAGFLRGGEHGWGEERK